jgi:hypothetical protein
VTILRCVASREWPTGTCLHRIRLTRPAPVVTATDVWSPRPSRSRPRNPRYVVTSLQVANWPHASCMHNCPALEATCGTAPRSSTRCLPDESAQPRCEPSNYACNFRLPIYGFISASSRLAISIEPGAGAMPDHSLPVVAHQCSGTHDCPTHGFRSLAAIRIGVCSAAKVYQS